MFPFDPPENIRKPSVLFMFSGGSKGNVRKKRVKPFTKSDFSASVRETLEKLKITFSGLGLHSVRSLLNFFCWMES